MSRVAKGPGAALFAVCAALLIALGGCGDDDEDRNGGGEESPAEFGYEGDVGPDRWADLDPAYAECADGREQSPIELEPARSTRQPRIAFDYEPARPELTNNGHSVEASFGDGTIEIGADRYELAQVHYHAPSEHRVNDQQLPLELHFVHTGEDDSITVVGVGAMAGAHNPAYDDLIASLPEEEGGTATAGTEIDPIELLPPDPGEASRFSYPGSLTTPPCTEGVRWEVLAEPIELSQEQLDAFTAIYNGNNRPLQDRNDRTPVRSG